MHFATIWESIADTILAQLNYEDDNRDALRDPLSRALALASGVPSPARLAALRQAPAQPDADALCTLRQLLRAGERREGWRSSLAVPGSAPRAVSVTAAPFCAEPGAVCDPRVAYVTTDDPVDPGDLGARFAVRRTLPYTLDALRTTLIADGGFSGRKRLGEGVDRAE
mgnify:CR=1 FL=1